MEKEKELTLFQKRVEIGFMRWWKDRRSKASLWDAYLEGYAKGMEKAMEVVREE